MEFKNENLNGLYKVRFTKYCLYGKEDKTNNQREAFVKMLELSLSDDGGFTWSDNQFLDPKSVYNFNSIVSLASILNGRTVEIREVDASEYKKSLVEQWNILKGENKK